MQAPVKAALGAHFLGTTEWKYGFGVNVGAPPPIPESITRELLYSQCPLHPGEKIKDTHILMLIPTTVDGKAYRALKLAELCSGRKGPGQRLIFEPNDLANGWKTLPWANLLQTQSEWVLLPKSNPDPFKVPVEKHFMDKNIAAQQDVHEEHYSEYREARALEVMTMVLLNEVVYGEPRILDGWKYPRCQEPNAYGGRVCVGLFDARGLVANDAGIGAVGIGRALAQR